MNAHTIPLHATQAFSTFFLDYIQDKESLKDLYGYYPKLENFKNSINTRHFENGTRKTLTQVLEAQYTGLDITEKVKNNIQKLKKPTTFTITTGHQLNIFTGPLYFLYKIITTINTCRQLKAAYPTFDFVPIYWMASEDHDFEEINHFYFEGEKYEWETDQAGPVGRFQTTDVLRDIVHKLPNRMPYFEAAYQERTLADATRNYVNAMFGNDGLVILNPDNKDLKTFLQPVMYDDILANGTHSTVSTTEELLKKKNYQSLAHCRKINFFYLETGLRSRIVSTEDTYSVLDQNLTFSRDQLTQLIQNYPEKFSPNVILRPLYQELILPNLAYVGGPTEILYWLQLKSTFEKHNICFPILMPRNFATIVPEHITRKWQTTQLSEADIFLGTQQAFTKWMHANTQKMLGFEEEIKAIYSLLDQIEAKASSVDSTLQLHHKSLKTLFENKLKKAESKRFKAEKRKYGDRERQIQTVIDTLIPKGVLQERHDNFLNYFLTNTHLISDLLKTLDPFNFNMYMLYQ